MRTPYIKLLIPICFFSIAQLSQGQSLQQLQQQQAELDAMAKRIETDQARLAQAAHKHHANRPASENDQAGVHAWNQQELRLRQWKGQIEAQIDQHNAQQAQLNRAVSNAREQAKSAQHHSQAAAASNNPETAHKEASRVFDEGTGGQHGSLDSMTVDARGFSKQDPVIRPSVLKAHPEMREEVAKRDAARADIQRIHEQLKTVDPKDTVQKAKLYDQEQRKERVVQFKNESLKKQLESLKGE